MALTLDTSTIVTISSADTTTGWTGPTLATEDEITKENNASLSSIVRNNGTQEYFTTNTQDYSGQHLRLWVSTGVYSKMVTSGKTGLRFYVEDGSNSASYWNIADKSTYQGGWINIVVDGDSPDSGSSDMTDIEELGIEFGLTSSGKRVVNTYVDYLRYGDGYTGYGTNWDLSNVVTADVSGGFGVVNLYEDIYFLTGNFQIGRASEQTTFSEVGSVISFVDAPVSSTLFGLTIIGQSSSTFEFDGCVLTAAGLQNFYLDFDDTGIDDLTFKGNTIQKASTSYFRADSTKAIVTGNVFDGCGTIYPQGSKFENNTIANTSEATNGSLYLSNVSTITNSKNITFATYSSKYAVYIPASVTGTISLDNFQFDGTGTDIYWAGAAGTLTINLTNGTNASTSSTAGGTINFVASPVTTEITALKSGTSTPIQNARVYLECTAGPLPYNVTVSITGSGTTATVTHTSHGYATNDFVVIKGSNQRYYNGSYTITVTDADTYTYTTTETCAVSPATGTITGTTVIFNSLTDVNGKVSDSRALSADQPVSGHVRMNSSSPYYKTSPLTGPISNSNGLLITAQMVSDE